MKIILSPNPYRDRGLKTAQAAARILKEAGVETRFCLPFEPDPRFELPKHLTYAEINQEIPTAEPVDLLRRRWDAAARRQGRLQL